MGQSGYGGVRRAYVRRDVRSSSVSGTWEGLGLDLYFSPGLDTGGSAESDSVSPALNFPPRLNPPPPGRGLSCVFPSLLEFTWMEIERSFASTAFGGLGIFLLLGLRFRDGGLLASSLTVTAGAPDSVVDGPEASGLSPAGLACP
jgi:hypothetical protein